MAIVEEARELRQTGVKDMIVILGGACEESVREAVRCGASQAVYEPEMLFELEDEAKKLGTTAKAHLKVDTGMTRIGVRGDGALNALLDAWKKCPHVEMEGIFTHFCVAENDPEFTRLQNERFERAIRIVRAGGLSADCARGGFVGDAESGIPARHGSRGHRAVRRRNAGG